MQFIDHRISPGNRRRPIALPVEAPVDDPRPERGGERQLARIGIDQRDSRVEAVSPLWVVGSMHVERVLRTRTGTPRRQESMPYVAGSRGQVVARRIRAAHGVEKRQFDTRCVARKDRKINAALVPRGAQGLWQSL